MFTKCPHWTILSYTLKKKATGTITAAGSRLDTGVEVDNNVVKKEQRHTAEKRPNMFVNVNKNNQYFNPLNRSSSG